MAPARNAACAGGSTSSGSVQARIPVTGDPAALRHLAARRDHGRHTRHFERSDQHRTLPVCGEGERLAQGDGIARREPERVGRLRQRLGTYVAHTKLRKVRVAGDGDGALHIDGSVRMIADIVLDGAIPPRDGIPAAPVAQRTALIGAMREQGIAAQGRDRGHQFEGRPWRILSVTRAVEQFVRRRRCGTRGGRADGRCADCRDDVARACLHHHQCSIGDSRLPQVLFQNLHGTHLQTDVHRHAQAAVARQNLRHAGVVRVMAVANERRQFRVLISLQAPVGVVLRQRRVARVKILSGAQIAGEVGSGGAERVVTAVEAAGSGIELDAKRRIGIAVAFQFLPVAGGQRNAVAVVDGSARDLARQRVDARVVLRAFDVVLFEGVSVASQVVAVAQHLIAQGETQQDGAGAGQHELQTPGRHSQNFRAALPLRYCRCLPAARTPGNSPPSPCCPS